MSRHVVSKGVLGLVVALILAAWIGLAPSVAAGPGARLSYDPATNTYTVHATGGVDTANIQAAFDGCAASSSKCTVQLMSGTFHTAQVVVRDFRGTFQGMGEDLTTVEALPNLPLGEFVTKPPSTDNPWPVLFTFFDGKYVIRDLTFSEPWPEPLPEWNACTGCAPTHALFAMISVTGVHAKAAVDHITMTGAAGDWAALPDAPILYNVINGIFPQALVLASGQTDFSGVTPLQVNFQMTNSVFHMIDNPSAGENLVDSTYVARFTTLDTVEFGYYFTNVGNSMVDVSYNVLDNVVYGTGLIANQNLPINVLMPCNPHSDLYFTHNVIQFTGLANGIVLADYGVPYGCPLSLDGYVTENTLRADETSLEAVVLYRMGAALVSGNVLTGGSTTSGVFVYRGAGKVMANDISGELIGVFLLEATNAMVLHNGIADSTFIGLFVLSSDDNLLIQNVITNSGLLDIAWDGFGIGNLWVRNTCQYSDPGGLCDAG